MLSILYLNCWDLWGSLFPVRWSSPQDQPPPDLVALTQPILKTAAAKKRILNVFNWHLAANIQSGFPKNEQNTSLGNHRKSSTVANETFQTTLNWSQKGILLVVDGSEGVAGGLDDAAGVLGCVPIPGGSPLLRELRRRSWGGEVLGKASSACTASGKMSFFSGRFSERPTCLLPGSSFQCVQGNHSDRPGQNPSQNRTILSR